MYIIYLLYIEHGFSILSFIFLCNIIVKITLVNILTGVHVFLQAGILFNQSLSGKVKKEIDVMRRQSCVVGSFQCFFILLNCKDSLTWFYLHWAVFKSPDRVKRIGDDSVDGVRNPDRFGDKKETQATVNSSVASLKKNVYILVPLDCFISINMLSLSVEDKFIIEVKIQLIKQPSQRPLVCIALCTVHSLFGMFVTY